MAQRKVQPHQIQTGTSTNDILQLDVDAKIPAVDGSQLINLQLVNSIESSSIGVVLTAADNHKKFNNQGASGQIGFVLPPAVVGMTFVFERTASFIVTVAPTSGAETFAGLVAGKYKSLDADGTYIYINCFSTGIWHIMALFGTTSDEP